MLTGKAIYVWQWHRTRKSCSYSLNIISEWLCGRAWWTKSQSSVLNVSSISVNSSPSSYLHFSNGLFNTCSHCTNLTAVCDTPLSRMAWHFTSFRKLHRSQCSYTWTEAPSGVVFHAAQKLCGVKHSLNWNEYNHLIVKFDYIYSNLLCSYSASTFRQEIFIHFVWCWVGSSLHQVD